MPRLLSLSARLSREPEQISLTDEPVRSAQAIDKESHRLRMRNGPYCSKPVLQQPDRGGPMSGIAGRSVRCLTKEFDAQPIVEGQGTASPTGFERLDLVSRHR
jgi:hypothetical protein